MKNLVVALVALGVIGIALMVVGAVLTSGDWVGLLLVAGGFLVGACVPLLALLWAVGVNSNIIKEIEKLDNKPRSWIG